jgi:hypothetical protein
MHSTSFLAQYALAVAVTFGLLAVLGWLASHYGQKVRGLPRGKQREGFTLLGRVQLNAQHQLHHVRFNNTDFIIATGPQGSTLISSTPSKKPKSPKT